ncbi:Exodeoxyribonuclease 7 small subunit [bacterium HR28]|uniref:Exodeoxyribonuclease 7 small subunit n=1 Tax=Thermomicrobium roseum TaxID=500 RepID=A0A7C1FRL1_THERO|nr:Exodeoxyribonuclease 7 small subunit [bacterium HR28]
MAEHSDGAAVPPHPIDLFEEMVSEVESIVQRLEAGDLPLAEAIREYQRGIELIRRCNEVLDQAELQISQLRTGFVGYEGSANTFGFLNGEDEDLPFS